MKTKVSELMTYKNFGKKSLTEVIEKLRDFEIPEPNSALALNYCLIIKEIVIDSATHASS